MSKTRRYKQEFKKEVADYIKDNPGVTNFEVAKKFNLTESQVKHFYTDIYGHAFNENRRRNARKNFPEDLKSIVVKEVYKNPDTTLDDIGLIYDVSASTISAWWQAAVKAGKYENNRGKGRKNKGMQLEHTEIIPKVTDKTEVENEVVIDASVAQETKTEIELLKEEINKINSLFTTVITKYTELETEHSKLWQEHTGLETSFKNLQKDHNKIVDSYNQLRVDYNKVNDNNIILRSFIRDAI